MLHKNHFYKYFGDVRDQEALIEFAVGNFHDGDHKEKIPKLPTLWDEIFDIFSAEIAHRGGFLKTFLLMDSEGNISYSALFCVYILPVLTVYGLYKLMQLPFYVEEGTAERTKAIEEKNNAIKKKMDAWVQKHPALRRKNRKWD